MWNFDLFFKMENNAKLNTNLTNKAFFIIYNNDNVLFQQNKISFTWKDFTGLKIVVISGKFLTCNIYSNLNVNQISKLVINPNHIKSVSVTDNFLLEKNNTIIIDYLN